MNTYLLIGIATVVGAIVLGPFFRRQWQHFRDIQRFRGLTPEQRRLLEIEQGTFNRGWDRDHEFDSFGVVLYEIHLVLERSAETSQDLQARQDWTDADYRRAEELHKQYDQHLTAWNVVTELGDELHARQRRDYEYYQFLDREFERSRAHGLERPH
jgi:hypothetical protein